MALPEIRLSGLSGLDTSTLVEGLLQPERAAMSKLGQRKTSLVSARSSLQELAGRARELLAKVRSLEGATVVRTATSTRGTEVTAIAEANAAPGVHEVSVQALAASSRLASQGVVSASDAGALGTGTLRITVGSTVTDVEVADGSLEGVRAAIAASGAAVTASVVSDGSATPHRLVVTGTATGLEHAVAVDASGLTGGATPLAFTTLRSAADAALTVDGVAMTRPSNAVADALQGVTLSLLAASAAPATLTVATDGASSARPLQDVIASYSAIVGTLVARGQSDLNGAVAGALSGDFVVGVGLGRLRGAIAATTGGSALPNLSAAGITTARDGTLTVDPAKLAAAWESAPDDMAALTRDLAARLATVADDLGRAGTGLFESRSAGVEASVRDLDARLARSQSRLERLEEQLVLKFAALESLVASFQSQANLLAQLSGGTAT